MTTRAQFTMKSDTQNATNSHWMERLARFGFVTRGLVCVSIGLLALKIASESGGPEADQRGALTYLDQPSFGQTLLRALALGLLVAVALGLIACGHSLAESRYGRI